MASLTTSIKDYNGTTEPIILDKESDANFPHRGRNCHHMIAVDPPAGEAINILYSFDGTNFIHVYNGGVDKDVLYDTGSPHGDSNPGFGGGGAWSCPPCLVKVTTSGGTAFTKMQVRTYGSMIR